MTALMIQSALALLAGILLNLTPCVLPAIPLKVRAIIAATGDAAPQRAAAAAALVAGSLAFFLALGAATAWLQWSWGALFQSRAFVTVLALFLVAAGVFTLGDLRLSLPQALYRVHGARHAEAFLTGALTGVLSTPCTGPFLGGVLAYALTNSAGTILWLFGAIGLGLALPYAVVILRPGLLARLPRSGEWSARLKQALGFVLLAGAVFFAQSLLPDRWGAALWLGWALGLATWGSLALWKAASLAGQVIPVAGACLGAWLTYAAITPSTAASLPWTPYTPVAAAAIAEDGRPALIEFTADWCINCKVLERTVYAAPRVIRAAQETQLAAFQVDFTEPDAGTERLLRSYGGAGIPFAVIVAKHGEVVRRLPDIFTAAQLEAAIRATQKGDAE
jgi:thiol:disulfide interchange protein DsbD